MRDIDLKLSEISLLSLLNEENIKLANLSEGYIQSKENGIQLTNEQDHPKSDENIKYHLNKLKK